MVARRFRRELESLRTIFGFVSDYLQSEGLDPESAFDVDLLIEELFTNMVRHERQGQPEVEIELEREGAVLTIVLRDFDVEPFDVTRVPPLDATQAISERRAGGMGLSLVRRIADTLHYQYQDRTSIITLTKRLES